MPLKNLLSPEKTDFTRLPLQAVLPALFAGFFCVITPLPQVVVSRSSTTDLLLTACIGPVCGILFMAGSLLKTGGKNILTLAPLKFRDIKTCIGGTFLIIFLSGLACAIWKSLLSAFHIPFAENQYLMTLAQNADPTEFLLLAFLVIVPVPIAEELLFRRILFAALLPWGTLTAWLGTAAVFAAAHLFLAGLPGLFIIGLGFQYLYIYRQNLAVSIVSHSLLNACAVLAVLASRGV